MISVPQPTGMTNLATRHMGCLEPADHLPRLVVRLPQQPLRRPEPADHLSRNGHSRNYYYSDQWQVLEERTFATGSFSSSSSWSSASTSGTPLVERQFTWGLRYIDDLVLRDRSVSGTLDERLYSMQDANWNVTAICDPTGTVQERYAYTAYGVVQFLNASFAPSSGNVSAYEWETLYCGYRYDAGTGLYLARNRRLNPLLGCWLRLTRLA